MGHIRLGRLPKTKEWRRVLEVLEAPGLTAADLATATAAAAADRFESLQRDLSIGECVWTLVRIASASKSSDFAAELNDLGIDVNRASTGLGFVAEVGRVVQKRIYELRQPSVFAEMAALSLKDVLAERVIEQAKSLFGTTLADVQSACSRFGTDKGFGEAARAFFARFTARTLQFFTDKELSNYIGDNKPIKGVSAARQLNLDMERFCRESALIVEEFASGWYSKQNWLTNRAIDRSLTLDFMYYALKKLQMELTGEEAV